MFHIGNSLVLNNNYENYIQNLISTWIPVTCGFPGCSGAAYTVLPAFSHGVFTKCINRLDWKRSVLLPPKYKKMSLIRLGKTAVISHIRNVLQRRAHLQNCLFHYSIYTLTRKERCFFAFSLLFEKMCYSATSLKLGKVINHLKYTYKDTIQIQIAKIKNKNIFFVFPSHRQVVTHYQYSIFGLNKNASIYVYTVNVWYLLSRSCW